MKKEINLILGCITVLIFSCKEASIKKTDKISMTDIVQPVEVTAGDSIVISGNFLNETSSNFKVSSLTAGCQCTKLYLSDSILSKGRKTSFQLTFKSQTNSVGPQDILVFLQTIEKLQPDTFYIRINNKRRTLKSI